MKYPQLPNLSDNSQHLSGIALVAALSQNTALLLDENARIVWANTAFEKIAGRSLASVKGARPAEFLYGPGTDINSIRFIRRRMLQRTQFDIDLQVYNSKKHPFWVHCQCIPVGKIEGVAPGFIIIQSDISATKAAQRSLRIADSMFEQSCEGILITDENNVIVDANPAFSQITGYYHNEVIGQNPRILSSGRQSADYYQTLWSSLLTRGYWRGEVWNRRKNGEEYLELLSIQRVKLSDGNGYYHIASFSDITALKNHAKDLDRATHYDTLTGLPNRQLANQRLEAACLHAAMQQRQLWIVSMDLDGFKAINDQHGVNIGDRALRILSERLASQLPPGDIVARVGGDEFLLVIQRPRDENSCQYLLDIVRESMVINGDTLKLSASLGVTRYPEDNTDAEGLIRHADQAMYLAKEKGRNLIHQFDPLLNEHLQKRRDQLTDISRGLAQNEFELFYQPQIRLNDSALIGLEALIRWHHPERGLLLPSAFLPDVENSHLDVPLGKWVVHRALETLQGWRKQGFDDIGVSINMSATFLSNWHFLEFIAAELGRFPDLPAHLITLEVLESSALDDIHQVRQMLDCCRELGLTLALDDFGTGFSSLTYMRTLPVNMIKIDRSFVSGMLDNPNDKAIVESIMFLCQRFDLNVLAEGVETPEQANMLKTLGCDSIQGFGVARPMASDTVLPWVRRWQQKNQCLTTHIAAINTAP
ncbi:EAL domain-containing protein [Marinobacter sp. M3C]|jgi:diguanylate cyclase (GGDEF)-like protein/PAS domain S-box-containing protein|uniref:putative bifunctional diguanylate cyclase/phosphodiesterase n=1 Tax=unclassified Marinobacter TaxID=83889 RepID=UPI00200F8458|nr:MULTISPECIES: bifunctional diguanylate cyclase/phosphodiesterase [unclassified Marinobacter]MCL1479791.1 EAL domain-containing protein [Marinobacter sp.]MCL1480755.1 EAL domain-containing protein [Marinobacter sp.]MCL1486803.1 EAL domain-containing protein [Marinobacter sp.]UQG56388.1 EAL domain-containing protein [Marinobacter sp. M4C]UQG58339.1 EAL domain-containing protein [Marinobacter sp. M3C]